MVNSCLNYNNFNVSVAKDISLSKSDRHMTKIDRFRLILKKIFVASLRQCFSEAYFHGYVDRNYKKLIDRIKIENRSVIDQAPASESRVSSEEFLFFVSQKMKMLTSLVAKDILSGKSSRKIEKNGSIAKLVSECGREAVIEQLSSKKYQNTWMSLQDELRSFLENRAYQNQEILLNNLPKLFTCSPSDQGLHWQAYFSKQLEKIKPENLPDFLQEELAAKLNVLPQGFFEGIAQYRKMQKELVEEPTKERISKIASSVFEGVDLPLFYFKLHGNSPEKFIAESTESSLDYNFSISRLGEDSGENDVKIMQHLTENILLRIAESCFGKYKAQISSDEFRVLYQKWDKVAANPDELDQMVLNFLSYKSSPTS